LQISGTQLRDKNGNPIQLAGMSSHGLTWFPLIDMNLNNATNAAAFKQQIPFNPTGGTSFPYTSSAVGNLVDQWHIQVIRASMFPYDPWNGVEAKSYDNGIYPEWKWYNINLVNAIVQSAINENIYVIIDWHAGEGNDQDPSPYYTSGHVQEFFTYMVDKWGSYPNVIYETVNSPVVSWNPTLKTFNQNVIDHIRAAENAKGYAYDNLILVGTPTWSQDVDVATNDPLTGNMIAYNYMWYAGTHASWVQGRGDTALANLATRAPHQTLFMGEVGTSSSNGSAGVYYSQFNTLMEWAKTRKLSWLNWSIANKEESSAIFKPAIYGNITNNEIAWRGGNGTIPQAMASTGQPMRMGPWNDADLSCSGKFVRGWMLFNTSQLTPAGC
jgi:endoglucanase